MTHAWHVDGITLLLNIQRFLDDASSPPTRYPTSAQISVWVCWDLCMGWATVPGAPVLITTAPLVFTYQWSDIPVTPKASWNALWGYDSLLKLTLLSSHSACFHTLLEAPTDYNTFCWCTWVVIYLPHTSVYAISSLCVIDSISIK